MWDLISITYSEWENLEKVIVCATNFFLLVAAFELVNKLKPRGDVASRILLNSVFQEADGIMS
jgi:hypothetical protein